ncbi:flagellar motor switch protein FliG [Buchnera aphidicola]|jgi:flagellar motor switch protein FliG|uniref:Flagellar motor switch protein FliG n=1 Tax=Buchnera aphidicola subsp. Schizaphis graminum (strain Sg) TaxID=198804 RepID=FLIG_BUCAP|nr:flagellar motor switch protein FliG [Buchnera aphidicola]Q8KA44.1 RecName: Full=Flagellar motor switch protein FliG [Buchnera aphidicola str. Sg (Schizaphis graminum)]AAM67638.1 flagellar motor switch protein FliG [Buchnera aphidicola str. Sg (Schizaphis graminum)]AWI49865.1 flagellar motor switch protein FliG [Buchnera aphidicola (Schizaphis graminum)]
MTLNGTEKSAILLMSIGADQASEVLKHLTPFEVQELVASMVNINQFSNTILNTVLSECYDLFSKKNNLICNNDENYISDVLTKTLGEKQGRILLNEVLETRNVKMCIETFNHMDPEKFISLLDQEHPQILTTILMYLDKRQSSKVLSRLSEKKCTEIVLRMAEFNCIKESNLIDLKKIIENLLKRKKLIFSEKNGIKTVAEILNSMKIEDEQNILKKINVLNKNLTRKIIKEMFLFDNIVNIEDKYIQCLISNLEKEKLCIALQGTSEVIRNKFFKNMNEEEANKLSIYLEEKSYISDIAIKNEQKLILIMLKNILDNGIFSLKKLGKYYV